jgi:hypothetical protein
MVLAFSLQSDVKSIGAYAGFAAIIGLALLVLLYFAQARELRRMSDLLDEQENRLGSMPARSPMARTPGIPPGRAVPMPPPAQPQEPSAAPIATVAIPGARRVPVAASGPPAAPSAEPASAPLTGAVAAATVAATLIGSGGAATADVEGAAAGTAAAPADADTPTGEHVATGTTGEEAGGESAPSGVFVSKRPIAPAAEEDDRAGGAPAQRGGEGPGARGPTPVPPSPRRGGSETPGGGALGPSAAVPLSSRPAATAEPVGAAAALGHFPPRPPVAPAERSAERSAETTDNGVVATADAVALPYDPTAAGEILAGRIHAPDLLRRDGDARERANGAAAEPADELPPPAPSSADELAPLGPSTAAASRPRFPPAPGDVSAPAAGGAAAGTGLLETAAATRRRSVHDAPDVDDDDARSGGSVLRLLAAAVVIVAVAVFIATKVFAPGGTGSPSRGASTVGGPAPSSVTVAVLNGTEISGLATSAARALAALGFQRGIITNALSHGHHVTLVSYTPGHLAAAREVAKDLLPIHTRVGPVDARSAVLAGAQGATPPSVVVTLGSDYQPQ